MMKSAICAAFGAVGTFIAAALGGWDHAIITLCTFMAIDYITGFVVAGVFHKSKKSNSGALESRAGFKGLCKKCTILLLVVIANLLDKQTGSNVIRDGVCITFIVNELVSILENASLMGLQIPEPFKKALGILKPEQDQEEN